MPEVSCAPAPPSSPEFPPVEFDDDAVNRALGAPARALLGAAHYLQSRGRVVHARRATLARWAGLTDRQVRRVLSDLSEAGLHAYRGEVCARAPRRGAPGGDEVVTLHVRDFLLPERDRAGRFRAGAALRAWASARAGRTWGGRRPGAGRPRGTGGEAGRRALGEAQPVVQAAGLSPRAAPPGGLTTPPRRGHYRGPAARRKGERPHMTEIKRSAEIPLPVLSQHLPLRPSGSEGGGARPRAPGESSSLGGRATRGSELAARLEELGRRALPPMPDHRQVPVVRLPAPAPIPSGGDDLARAEFLAAAYRAAVRRRFFQPSSYFLVADPSAHRDYPRLVEAAAVLEAAQAPPAAWCLFSFDVWGAAGHARPPTVAFTYSPARLRDRMDWFDRERDRYCFEEAAAARGHVALLEDWRAMWFDLLARAPETREGLLAVVDAYFPGASYEQRVAEARAEAAALQAQVDAEVRAGGVVWGR